MADILRGPLVQQGKSWPNTVTQIAFPNILLGLVAAAFILPAGEQSFPLQTQHPSHALTANRDTTRGTPATLTGGGAKPFIPAPHLSPPKPRIVVDTSAGTPKVLIPDASRSFKNPPQFLIERVRPVIDTSAGLNLPVSTTVVENPRKQTDWPAPIEFRYQFHNNTWDQQANPALIPAAVVDALIGRKYPRHGKRGKRIIHEDIPQIAEKLADKRESINAELLIAKAEVENTRLMTDNVIKRANNLARLEVKVKKLEADLAIAQEEEELLLLVAFAIGKMM